MSAACVRGDLETLKFLCDAKMDFNSTNKFGQAPLHICTRRGFVKGVETLIEYKANVNAVDHFNVSVLETQSRNNGAQIRKLLIDAGAVERKKVSARRYATNYYNNSHSMKWKKANQSK